MSRRRAFRRTNTRTNALLSASFVAAVLALQASAAAQPVRKPSGTGPVAGPPSTASSQTNLRAHVGADYAARLLRSTDPSERLRGIRRAASIGSNEAVVLLAQAAEGTTGGTSVRGDPRALVELARALSRFADQERARTGLFSIVGMGSPTNIGRVPQVGRAGDALSLEEGDPVERTELARRIAALALARTGQEKTLEQLVVVAKSGGSGQGAALSALGTYPPKSPSFHALDGATLPPSFLRMLGHLGDLRALNVLRAAAGSTDVDVRAAALVSLAELGDERTIALARTAIAEPDARLRAAAGEVFVLLSAPERVKAVSALVSDEATTAIGVRLAARVHDTSITKLLAARAAIHPVRALRSAAIHALGRSPDPEAATALTAPSILDDPGLAYEALLALSRSPAPNATALLAGVAEGKQRGLGVRAYVVRALLRGERNHGVDELLAKLAQSKDGKERALGVFGRIALGDASVEDFLGDGDARVRRAAAMGSLARPSKSTASALLVRMNEETDAVTRQVLAIGLVDGDPRGSVTTTMLVDRAESGGADAALSTFAFMKRAEESDARRVTLLLGSKDPVIRAHAARGLATAKLEDASGRLAEAYAYETNDDVRHAIVSALVARTRDASSPARKETLAWARELDPDAAIAAEARLAEPASATMPTEAAFTGFSDGPLRDVAWLRLVADDGGAPRMDARAPAFVGSVVRADGMAVPISFDDDGFALVPGLPPGNVRLVLAPRLPSYEAARP